MPAILSHMVCSSHPIRGEVGARKACARADCGWCRRLAVKPAAQLSNRIAERGVRGRTEGPRLAVQDAEVADHGPDGQEQQADGRVQQVNVHGMLSGVRVGSFLREAIARVLLVCLLHRPATSGGMTNFFSSATASPVAELCPLATTPARDASGLIK